MAGRVRQSSERLTRSATRADGLLGGLAGVADCFAHRTTGPERRLAELADAPDGVVDGLHEALEDFGVPVERGQRSIEDVVEVLEAHLQLGLRLDSLDVDFDLSQAHVDAGNDLEQVRELRAEREMRRQAFDVNVDLIDLYLADVDVDIRIVARFPAFELRDSQREEVDLRVDRLFRAAGLRAEPDRRVDEFPPPPVVGDDWRTRLSRSSGNSETRVLACSIAPFVRLPNEPFVASA